MDLTRITDIDMDPSTALLDASPQELTKMPFTFANGVVVEPVVEPRVVGYKASHPDGGKFNVVELEINSNPVIRCLVVEDENGNTCTGVRIPPVPKGLSFP